MDTYLAVGIAVATGILVAAVLACMLSRGRTVTAHYSRTKRGKIRWALKDGKGKNITVSTVNGFSTRAEAERDAERLSGLKVRHAPVIAPYTPKEK